MIFELIKTYWAQIGFAISIIWSVLMYIINKSKRKQEFKIGENQIIAGDISNLTRFYVLYRWSYGEAKLHFDEARKLSTSANVALEKEWNRPGFIKKEKEFIIVLGPQDRNYDDFKNSSELIDILHAVLLLWEKGRRNEMITLLNESGYGKSDAFYRVAQTISETLPNESKEKKLLDGFLSGKMRLQEEIKIKTRKAQINLFNYKDK